MDAVTKANLLDVISGNSEAEAILFEMGAFTGDDGLSRLVNRRRVAWLHSKRIWGRELVNFYNTHGSSAETVCEAIDNARKLENQQDTLKKIYQLASDLTNDETDMKNRLLALSSYLKDNEVLLEHLLILTKIGMDEYMRELLRVASAETFVNKVLEVHREYSEREQRYANAKLCSERIVSIKLIKCNTLSHIKHLILAKLGEQQLHSRALILYNLLCSSWEGSLRTHIESLYHKNWEWKRFLSHAVSAESLVCYVLLCSADEIQKIRVFMNVLNQRVV